MAHNFVKSCISPISRKAISAFCCGNVNAAEATTEAYGFITISSPADTRCVSVVAQTRVYTCCWTGQAEGTGAPPVCWRALAVRDRFTGSRGSWVCWKFASWHLPTRSRDWNSLIFRDPCYILVMPRGPAPELEGRVHPSALGMKSAFMTLWLNCHKKKHRVEPVILSLQPLKTQKSYPLLAGFWINDNWI